MSEFKGFAPLQTAQHLYAKLQRDFARIRANPSDADAAFDFFVTAEHLVDWMLPDEPGRDRSAERKNKRRSSPLLSVVSQIANGAKHFEATAKHHTSVKDVELRNGGFDSMAFSPRAFSPSAFKLTGLHVILTNGEVAHVLVLAEAVLSYWKTDLGG